MCGVAHLVVSVYLKQTHTLFVPFAAYHHQFRATDAPKILPISYSDR